MINAKNNFICETKQASFLRSSIEKLFIYNAINERLSMLNQRSKTENFFKSIGLSIVWIALGSIYFFISLYLFHSLWYHSIFSLLSTIVFMYLCYEYYFDWLEKSIKADLPKCCRKLAHYYTHYKGNIIHALKETEERGPVRTRVYMMRIRKALESVNMNEEVNELKKMLPYSWLKMLCVLMMLGKDNGTSANHFKSSDVIIHEPNEVRDQLEKNIRRITNILYMINIEQGRNDADLFGVELFMFISPYMFIICTELFNRQILMEMNALDIYQGIQAQSLKAIMFLVGNLSAVFIHWIRRQQN